MRFIEKIKSFVQRNSRNTEGVNYVREVDEMGKMPVRKERASICSEGFLFPHMLTGSYHKGASLLLKGEVAAQKIAIEINGKNLYSGESKPYYIKSSSGKEFGKMQGKYLTTDWFRVDASQRYLIMTGDGFNRGVWQFQDKNRKIILEEETKVEKYRVVNQKQFDHTCAKTAIPSNAAWARVYFAKTDEEDCAPLGELLQITYGLIPEMVQPYKHQELHIETGEDVSCIQLRDTELALLDSHGHMMEKYSCEFSLKEIESIWIEGIGSCEAFFEGGVSEKKENEEKEYGIRWNMESPIPVCQRVGDAENMQFNYLIGNEWAGNYPNDFDEAYPWNEMRVCAVTIAPDGSRKICYEGEPGFSRDGSAGEVLIEIPLYYAKREQKDGYEYLWITKSPKDGYELDPSFRTSEGIRQHIYMSAYLGSEKKGVVHSHGNTFVSLRRSMKEYQEMIAAKQGYEAYDFLMHLTIQRLFLIETAVLDSQAIFDGIVYLPYKVVNTKTAYYALEDQMGTNEIMVKDTAITRRLLPGDCVTVLDRWNQYKNTPSYQRMVQEVRVENGKRYIRFSGPPMDIYKERTAISALPRKNGDTDSLNYHTARGNENHRFFPGHETFRYRGIENLWGNAWVNFGRCFVKNNKMHITFPDGTRYIVGYSLPVQNVILTSKQFGSPTEMCVRRMGYDPKNPLLMLPSEIGNGASTNTYYCDAWYNIAEEDVEYLLSYGGAWDNLGYAGIFCYRANYGMKDKIPFIGVRLILR